LAVATWSNFSRRFREAEVRCSARLATERLDALQEYADFESRLEGDGAVVTFVGVARPTSAAGGNVTSIFLEHHPRLTEDSLREIAHDAGRRFDVSAICVVHRCGNVAPGEPIVFVASAAVHRRAAFQAVEYAMDRLKTDAVFWKREDAVDGSRWIEPTILDQVDRDRWSD
jgi:molybdopterin synthase catalytic subunit